MFKALFALPFAALALIAAAPKQAPVAPPEPSLVAPADVVANPANKLSLELSNGGTVVIQMRPDLAPNHVQRVQTLVRQGFYNGLTFHRVVPGFMAQGGDPKGTGEGGSSLPDLKAEFTSVPFMRGTVAAARTQEPDTANSQFFIMFAPNPGIDGQYTIWGRVISGMDAVDAIAVGEPPANPTKIIRATLGDMAAAPAK
ncbi:peptidylprolyl isomerase [Sphingomonas limnosediminicola]|uniref:Peptidyl-prolyl cis-trans isomerase n=1 Tax=Sphingomonas limnosediminicola TaxID=940133 RepID=A0ABP7L0S4_9SPHN